MFDEIFGFVCVRARHVPDATRDWPTMFFVNNSLTKIFPRKLSLELSLVKSRFHWEKGINFFRISFDKFLIRMDYRSRRIIRKNKEKINFKELNLMF